MLAVADDREADLIGRLLPRLWSSMEIHATAFLAFSKRDRPSALFCSRWCRPNRTLAILN